MKPISVPIYDLTGKTIKTMDLDPAVFAVEPNVTLLHQAVITFLGNRRPANAHTKDRGEVAGSNRKPWRQKGTGNARAGSFRSPLWRGGGVTFGPTNERNYAKRLPQKMRQAAFKMALSAKVKDNDFIIVTDFTALTGKTQSWTKAFAALPRANDKATKTLVVDAAKNDMAERSVRNVADQKYVPLEGVTLVDLLRFSNVVITQEAVEGLTKRLVSNAAEKDVVASEATQSTPTKARKAKAAA